MLDVPLILRFLQVGGVLGQCCGPGHTHTHSLKLYIMLAQSQSRVLTYLYWASDALLRRCAAVDAAGFVLMGCSYWWQSVQFVVGVCPYVITPSVVVLLCCCRCRRVCADWRHAAVSRWAPRGVCLR
jgi:hypothetical protein